MSKYPVETSDLDGVIEGVNYLLSGPAGLGQNFSGKSFTGGPSDFSGSPRGPYLFPDSSYFLYVAPIIGTLEMLDEVTYKFTYDTPTTTPAFYLGCPLIYAEGAFSSYNQTFSPIGVVECTNDYVIVRSDKPRPMFEPRAGGTVTFNVVNNYSIVTDCQANVTVTGVSDRVFLSGQLETTFIYNCTSDATLFVTVSIARSQIFNKGSQTDPMYYTDLSFPIFTQAFTFDVAAGVGGLETINAIFTSFIDQDYAGVTPATGYYNYGLEILFSCTDPTAVTISSTRAGTRTLTAQVVKE